MSVCGCSFVCICLYVNIYRLSVQFCVWRYVSVSVCGYSFVRVSLCVCVWGCLSTHASGVMSVSPSVVIVLSLSVCVSVVVYAMLCLRLCKCLRLWIYFCSCLYAYVCCCLSDALSLLVCVSVCVCICVWLWVRLCPSASLDGRNGSPLVCGFRQWVRLAIPWCRNGGHSAATMAI